MSTTWRRASAAVGAHHTFPPRPTTWSANRSSSAGRSASTCCFTARRPAQPVGVVELGETRDPVRPEPIDRPGHVRAQALVGHRRRGPLAQGGAGQQVPRGHGPSSGRRRGEDLGQVADVHGPPRGLGPRLQVHQAGTCRSPRGRRPRGAGLEGPQRFVGHRHGRLGQLHAERSPNPQHRSDPSQATTSHPPRRRASGARWSTIRNSRSMWQLVQGDAERPVEPSAGRSSACSVSSVSSRVRPPTRRPGGGMVVADHLEQLGPEDADHRGARPRRDHHGLGPAVQVGLQRGERGAGHGRGVLGEAGVPRRLAAAGLVQVAGHVATGARSSRTAASATSGATTSTTQVTSSDTRTP